MGVYLHSREGFRDRRVPDIRQSREGGGTDKNDFVPEILGRQFIRIQAVTVRQTLVGILRRIKMNLHIPRCVDRNTAHRLTGPVFQDEPHRIEIIGESVLGNIEHVHSSGQGKRSVYMLPVRNRKCCRGGAYDAVPVEREIDKAVPFRRFQDKAVHRPSQFHGGQPRGLLRRQVNDTIRKIKLSKFGCRLCLSLRDRGFVEKKGVIDKAALPGLLGKGPGILIFQVAFHLNRKPVLRRGIFPGDLIQKMKGGGIFRIKEDIEEDGLRLCRGQCANEPAVQGMRPVLETPEFFD